MTLVENFICQHFDAVYSEILNGTTGQSRYDSKGRLRKNYSWKVEVKVKKSDVLLCMKQFFHLCLNAGTLDSEFKKLSDFTRVLLINACSPQGNSIFDYYKFTKMLASPEQYTHFLFSCFDWKIDRIKEYDKKKNGLKWLDKFDWRIQYFKDHINHVRISGGNAMPDQLLYDLRGPRNEESHYAKDYFISERTRCLQQLVYVLYDLITIFYMISKVCKEDDGSSIAITAGVQGKVRMPADNVFLTTQIEVDCVDEATGQSVDGRKNDLRLYGGGIGRTTVSAEKDKPGCFRVSYFSSYVITLFTDGTESLPSEPLVIDQQMTEGTVVKLNIPSMGKPNPVKVSVRELVFAQNDLPADLQWVLEQLEKFDGNSEIANVARLMAVASVTKSEENKRAYAQAMENLRESISKELVDGQPQNVNGFLQQKMQEFQDTLAKPYKDNEDFKKLCKSLDELYNLLEMSDYSAGTPLHEQMLMNAKNAADGSCFSVATTATDETNRQTKLLASLKLFLDMEEKFPDIVESESGRIIELIGDIFITQTNYYVGLTYPLRSTLNSLLEEIQKEGRANASLKKAEVYVFMLDRFLNDIPENVVRIVKLIWNTLIYWVGYSNSDESEKIKGLRNKCIDCIKQIRDNENVQVPMIRVDEKEKGELEQYYKLFSDSVKSMKSPSDMIDVARDSSWMLAELRYDILMKLSESFSSNSLMQVVCCSLNWKRELGWLLNSSDSHFVFKCFPQGYDYTAWEKENKGQLQACEEVVNQLWKNFSASERHRVGEEHHATEVEMRNAMSKLLIAVLKGRIEETYKNDVPDFIKTILYSPKLPDYIKNMLLQRCYQPCRCQEERLVFITATIFTYWNYFSLEVRQQLSIYVTGDYGKKLTGDQALKNYFIMHDDVKKEYLNILMDYSLNLGGLKPRMRYMQAYRLIFNSGCELAIDEREFYLMMSCIFAYDIEIDEDNYVEFCVLCLIISAVSEYSNKHPEDLELSDNAKYLNSVFIDKCLKHLDTHLKHATIQDRRMQKSVLRQLYLHNELKGKSEDEQTVVRYLDLYDGLSYKIDDAGRFQSGWLEEERKRFNNVISAFEGKDTEYCQKIMGRIAFYIENCLPYDDIRAERFLALKPYIEQKELEHNLHFIKMRAKRGVSIANPDVAEGLCTIRNLFSSESDFIDILLHIYGLMQSLLQKV